jgi:ATP-dependent helicase/nuclease subunit B
LCFQVRPTFDLRTVAESPRRHFLSWDRPLLPQAVAWLARGWPAGQPLDLTRTLIIVPTRQSGRRLREALATAAAERGQGVLAPRVVTPEVLLGLGAPADVAPRLVSLLAWAEVFLSIALEDYRAVFPLDPPARNFGWAVRLGREFARLQSELAEGGLGIADVAPRAGPDFPEAARWEAMGRLERLHSERLAAAGWREAQAVRRALARRPPPLDFDRIVVLATPDPMPLAVEFLAGQAGRQPVDVVIFAPEEQAAAFDAWGRTRVEIPEHPRQGWATREVRVPHFAERVRLAADPDAQAELIAGLAAAARAPGSLGLGVADPEVLIPLENALGRAGLAAFNPEGRSRRHDPLYGLLSALAALAEAPEFSAVAALARCPDVLAWLQVRLGAEFSPARFLAELDELHADHLPPSLAAAQVQAARFPLAGAALAEVATLRHTLVTGTFPGNAAAALAQIFGARRVESGGVLADSAEAWMTILRETAHALAALPGVRPGLAEAWELALQEFAGTARTAERPAESLDLLGWLELLWEDAPHLVIAGFNDGRVPDAVAGDAFLPEGLRARLGLKTNAARFARDAYLLTALLASRTDGRVDLLYGRTSRAGDPLRPSRLLLACPETELPQRVEWLFQPLRPVRPGLPWSRAWRLRPRRVAALQRIPVTGLRDWLKCPFRFYLRHGLRMSAVDPGKAELDAGDFGTLLHVALQEMGAERRDVTDEAELAEFLITRFEHAARVKYGDELTLPLLVQFESARQRLRAAAAVEARERAEGWRTERVEWRFELPLGPLTLRGTIDRLDRHPDGRVRVLDYKTSDTGRSPVQSHLRSVRPDDEARAEWHFWADDAGRRRIWADLQLPLYRRAVLAEWGADVTCGYFNLPKAAGETGLSPWTDYTPGLQEAAERCAGGVAAAIAAGTFWPPAELTGREADADDFAALFHEGAAASLDFGPR